MKFLSGFWYVSIALPIRPHITRGLVTIVDYHIVEAGANPIRQLAFTLNNGANFVEAYLASNTHTDDCAPIIGVNTFRDAILGKRKLARATNEKPTPQAMHSEVRGGELYRTPTPWVTQLA